MGSSLLKIKKQAEEIKRMYDEDPRTQSYNLIVHGKKGVGKTSLLKTCRKPVLVHSFDPDGTEVLKEEIAKGEIIADTRFEIDDPYKPTACREWEDEFNKLRKIEMFNHLGTFAMDTSTTWLQIIMYEVIRIAALKSAKRTVGEHPHQQDWLPQMAFVENYMRIFTSLPCDCILLGHSDQASDEDGMPLGDRTLMVTGKLKERIPALFSEVYYLEIKDFKTMERRLLTQPAYGIQAGTRLGRDGRFEKYEKANIKRLLGKAGMSKDDKPLLHTLKDEEETKDE